MYIKHSFGNHDKASFGSPCDLVANYTWPFFDPGSPIYGLLPEHRLNDLRARPLRNPKYHLLETIRPLIEVHWGIPKMIYAIVLS